ncbi:MAG: MBL fold metallo-hydrolase [Undibacterium sp.]|nr:MBL fold metallo-hydrolase [Undibacterium sp.]
MRLSTLNGFKKNLVGASLATLLGAATLFALPTHAATPMVKSATPGFYRVMLGDFEVTALFDGAVNLPVDQLLTNTTKEKTIDALKKFHLASPVETSVNAYLINTGTHLVLIDTGAANRFGPTLGKLQASLKAAGYQAEQIDEVYITHMHGDHLGGLIVDEKMAFPNAVIRADQQDMDFWLSQANMDKAAADAKGFFQVAMASINPYLKAGKFKAFDGDTELVPGIKAIATHGHTAGHTIYAVESKGQKLMLWGDLMHVAAVQFENPSITIKFDSDSKAAMAQRKKAYADAAKQGYMVGVAHISFPGLGYVRSEAKGYAWVPVNYSPLK